MKSVSDINRFAFIDREGYSEINTASVPAAVFILQEVIYNMRIGKETFVYRRISLLYLTTVMYVMVWLHIHVLKSYYKNRRLPTELVEQRYLIFRLFFSYGKIWIPFKYNGSKYICYCCHTTRWSNAYHWGLRVIVDIEYHSYINAYGYNERNLSSWNLAEIHTTKSGGRWISWLRTTAINYAFGLVNDYGGASSYDSGTAFAVILQR